MISGVNSVGESRRSGFVRNKANRASSLTHSDTETLMRIYSDPMLPDRAAVGNPRQSSTIISGYLHKGRDISLSGGLRI